MTKNEKNLYLMSRSGGEARRGYVDYAYKMGECLCNFAVSFFDAECYTKYGLEPIQRNGVYFSHSMSERSLFQ